MAGYIGPNNRRYERPQWWWLSFTVIPVALTALWGLVKSYRRSKVVSEPPAT